MALIWKSFGWNLLQSSALSQFQRSSDLSFKVSVTVDSAIEYADESGGRAYARKAHCANLFEWLARLMVSCTQFPGNLIPSEIDLILLKIKVVWGWNQMHVRSRGCLAQIPIVLTVWALPWERSFPLKTRLPYLEHTWRASHRDARLSRHGNLIRISGSFHGD